MRLNLDKLRQKEQSKKLDAVMDAQENLEEQRLMDQKEKLEQQSLKLEQRRAREDAYAAQMSGAAFSGSYQDGSANSKDLGSRMAGIGSADLPPGPGSLGGSTSLQGFGGGMAGGGMAGGGGGKFQGIGNPHYEPPPPSRPGLGGMASLGAAMGALASAKDAIAAQVGGNPHDMRRL